MKHDFKPMGAVRKIDKLGRLVIPKHYRDMFDIKFGDKMEMFVNQSGEILIRHYKSEV